ncbi:hypothetical protein KEM56_007259 [Ascosphaera pollenicola]|nr:hypothetical protein KEM56_007259 [Ascosphaera pollenicola]
MLSSRIRPLNNPNRPTAASKHNPFTSSSQDQNPDADPDADADTDADAESLLSSFLPHLFPDDTPVCLGDPGQALAYSSPQWGDMEIWVPDYGSSSSSSNDDGAKDTSDGKGDGDVEANRKLFAHYLWGGALVIADEIERRYRVKNGADSVEESALGNVREEELWDVEGKNVLELGAGAALPSLIALRSGARSVTITDHPSAKGIYGPIQQSLAASVPASLHQNVSINPYTWGVFPDTAGTGAKKDGSHKEIEFAAAGKSLYARIIVADCLWMPEQHDNLAKSIAWYLAPPAMPLSKARAAEKNEEETEAATDGAAYVVAGYHTGRDVVASFFENAVPNAGLLIERIYERDLNAREEDGRAGRVTREWTAQRPDECDRSRWCVVAFLRRRR